ncbi:MAG TPA: hypothetical protein VFZ34_05410 [Blastocatellia bacterium]|nr:hypothetical protein [Blastocatellia bacterium]
MLQYLVRERSGERAPYLAPILYKINRTDDRGVYRIFGLPPGKYLVCVGDVKPTATLKYIPPTYYHVGRNEGAAKVVEVSTGGEVTGIDIKLAKPQRTFRAQGRIVDATTGVPLAGLRIRSVVMKGEEGQLTINALAPTNLRGEFQFQGLRPGRHIAYLNSEDGSEYYSDAVPFEVLQGDVSGLELKATRGASISGNIAITGTNDPQLLAHFQTFSVHVSNAEGKNAAPSTVFARPAADGSFRLAGLRPGKVKLALGWNALLAGPRPFLLRVEKGSAELTEGVLLQAGEHITGVRMIVAYGTGTVRGQIHFVGGELPPGTLLHIVLRKTNGAVAQDFRVGQVDVSGRFLFEGLLTGEHQMIVNLPSTLKLAAAVQQEFLTPQIITVAANAETPVTLTVDLRNPDK